MSPKPHVSLHALRRVGDRVLGLENLPIDDAEAVAHMRDCLGFDVEQIAALVRQVVARGVTARAAAVTQGGFRFILHGATVVTVVSARAPKRRRRVVDRDDWRYRGGSGRGLTDGGHGADERLCGSAAEARADADGGGYGDGAAQERATESAES